MTNEKFPPYNTSNTKNSQSNVKKSASSSSWDTNFTYATYKIKMSDSNYALMKEEITKEWRSLQAIDPEFKPRVRFDNGFIEIAHSYRDFYALIPQQYKNLFPHPTQLKFPHSPTLNETSIAKGPNAEVFAIPGGHCKIDNGKYVVLPFPADQTATYTPPKKLKEISLPENITKNTLIPHLIKENKTLRLVIGEQHSNTSARDMLINAMHLLKGKTIAVEQLFFESHQEILDRWMKASPTALMPIELVKATAASGLQSLLIEAKIHQVNILAIGAESLIGLPDASRASSENCLAKALIDNKVGQGDFIALVGAGHAADYTLQSKAKTIYGLGSIIDNSTSIVAINSSDFLDGKEVVTRKDIVAYTQDGSLVSRLQSHIVVKSDPKNQNISSKHVYKIEDTFTLEDQNKILAPIQRRTVETPKSSPKKKPFLRKQESYASSSSRHEPDDWNTKFQAVYHIQINKEHTSKTNESVETIYEQLKDSLIDTFEPLVEQNPDFTPHIRFNDKANRVEIGHSYNVFYACLGEELKPFFPEPSVNLFSKTDPHGFIGVKDYIEIHTTPFGDELVSQGEKKIFGSSPTHKDFEQDKKNILKNSAHQPYRDQPPAEATRATLIQALINQAHEEKKPFRIILGEDHQHNTARKMLMDAMPLLAGSTLVLEGFFYATDQKLLDAYRESKNSTSFPFEFRNLDPDLQQILLLAKVHNVRIIAGDAEILYLSKEDRAGGLNAHMKKIIDFEVGSEKSFIALVGAAHAANYEVTLPTGEKKNYPGLRSLLKATSIIVINSSDHGEDILTNKIASLDSKQLYNASHSTPTDAFRGSHAFNSDFVVRNPTPTGDITLWHKIKDRPPSIHRTIQRQSSILDVNTYQAENSTSDTEREKSSKSDNTEDKPKEKKERLQSPIPEQNVEEKPRSNADSVSSQTSQSISEPTREKTALNTADIVRKTPQQNTPLSLSHQGFDKGMTILGVAGGINSIYRGNIVGGVVSIAESTAEITGFGAETILTNKNLLQSATQGKKAAETALKTAVKFAKVLPIIGAGFAAYGAVQSGKDFLFAQEGIETTKARINFLLDGAIFISTLLPGPGTVAILGLVAARFLSDMLIDQIADPEAYKKTWKILYNTEATLFEKVIAAPKGAIQFVWSHTPGGILYSLAYDKYKAVPLNRLSDFRKINHKDFLTISKDDDYFAVNFSQGPFSNHAGGLNVVIDTHHIFFNVESAVPRNPYIKSLLPSHSTLCSHDSNPSTLSDCRLDLHPETPKKMLITMTQGVTYKHTIERKFWGGTTHIKSLNVELQENSFISTYNATNADTDVTFIAPSQDPSSLQDYVTSQALGKGFNSFHYKIFGGKKENIYILGKQNATITCGSGKNFIQLPFDDKSSSRTLIIQDFRDDASCTIELKKLRSDSHLLQQAKLKMGEELNLYIGQTTIKIKPSGKLEKILIRTEDAILTLDVTNIASTPSDTEYLFKDIINSTYMGYKNLWKKDAAQHFSNIKDHDGVINFLKDLLSNTHLYKGDKGDNFDKELEKLSEYSESERKNIAEKSKKIDLGDKKNQSPCRKEYTKKYKYEYVKAVIQRYEFQKPEYDCLTTQQYESLRKESLKNIKSKLNDFLKNNFKSNDTYTGTSGEDLFIINDKECAHTQILKFDDLKDRFNITKLKTNEDVKSFISQATQKDADVFISFDEYNSITIKDMMLSQLDPDDFLLGNIAY